MDLKNLMSHAVRPVNPTTTGELPATEFQLSAQDELIQLSEEDLRKINGGEITVTGRGLGNAVALLDSVYLELHF